MYQDQTVFSQLMEFLPRHTFRKCVNRYQGNYRMRSFSCYDQFLCMAFAQLTARESLRDIECCLRALDEKLYHAGFRGNISRSTLADANESRDWRIYADFAQHLIHEARILYVKEDFGLQLTETVYALDSSTIDLCLSLFPWARFRTTKAGIKLHTLLDLRGSIPLKGRLTSVVKHKPVHDLVALHDRLKFENAFGQKRLRPERRRIGRRTENRNKNHIHDAKEQQFFSHWMTSSIV